MLVRINLILQRVVVNLINKRNKEKADERFFADILKQIKS